MKTTRLLIAALGGEGGGVLANWIVAAARAQDVACQATSVPGVAQRTGATTYYLEMAPRAAGRPDPIFALMPVPGDVDVVLASELLEAARMVERGFVAPDRTFLLASIHRMLTTREKMAPGDGRLDGAALMKGAEKASRARFLFDAQRASQQSGAPVNAVLLGVLAGLELLPIVPESFRRAIEEGGVAVARNLGGFDAGLELAKGAGEEEPNAEVEGEGARTVAPSANREAELAAVPEAAREVVRLGLERLRGYQDAAYARLYLERLNPFRDDPELMREVARHLAVRMSFEDIIRVAQLKVRASRFERIGRELGAEQGEPYEIVDFFKPGIPELADMLPPAPGRRLLAWAERKGIRDRANLGMRVRSTTISGFLRIWLLARMKPWRRRSLRFANEQAAIENWLALVAEARGLSRDFALQTAELARLVKGYGDTHRRGQATFDRLVERLVRPALEEGREGGAEQLRAAIETALATAP